MGKRARTFERGLLLSGLGRVEAQELGEFAAVLSILVNTEFQVLAKGFVKLVEVVLVLRNLTEKIHTFPDDVLANDL